MFRELREEGTGQKEMSATSSLQCETSNDQIPRDRGRKRKGGDVQRSVMKVRTDLLSSFRYPGLQREFIPHGDVSDRLLYAHTGCTSCV